MSEDARRALTEEERARAQAAKTRGGLCGRCGRALAEGETVWIERVPVGRPYGRRPAVWWVPVGGECASPAFRAEVEGREPAPCVGCGRGLFYRRADSRRRAAVCSRRCGQRAARTRAKEARQ